MNARDAVLFQYEGLGEGTTVAGELCPACEGGSTREGSLSVTSRDGRLLWHCHRDSCGFKGSVRLGGRTNWPATKVPRVRGIVGRELARESRSLDQAIRQTLFERYKITDEHVAKYELGWDTEDNSLVIPVRNFHGEILGANLRRLDDRKPKTKLHTEENAISWFVNHVTPGVIIVEDQFSAIRASDYLTSVALLGTHLNEHRAEEIQASGCTPVFMALDGDAFSKGVQYAIQYRQQLKPILVKLTKDIKDMSHEELQELMNEKVLDRLETQR